MVLISGGVTRDLLAAARVLAGCGARLVLAGTAGTSERAALDLGLASLRGAGADVSYVPADLSDPDQAETAIGSAEQRVGPVTAIVHAAGTGPLRKCGSLSGDDLGAQIARQADGLSNVLGAVSAAGLRVLVTLGTSRPATARPGTAHPPWPPPRWPSRPGGCGPPCPAAGSCTRTGAAPAAVARPGS